MSNITVGVPYVGRKKALENLLESLPTYIDKVIIADNSIKKDSFFIAKNFDINFKIIKLEKHIGIGKCRFEINQACNTKYIFICDSDMKIKRENDLITLKGILDYQKDLGGIAGILQESNVLRSGGTNLNVRKTLRKRILVRSNTEPPEIKSYLGVNYAEFDFIPQSGLFKTKVFNDYNYDPNLILDEHTDLFYGHKQLDKWKFAVTPIVVIQHDRGKYTEYRDWRNKRFKKLGIKNRKKIFKEKWDIDNITTGGSVNWFTTHRNNREKIFDVIRNITSPKIWIPLKQMERFL